MLGHHALESADIHIALKRVVRIEIRRFRTGQVERGTAPEFDIGAGRIEMRVVRHDRVRADHDAEQDSLRCPALVRGDDLLESEDVLYGVAEVIPALRAGVGFVATHHGAPGFRGHGARARIRQEVDDHVLGAQQERVVVCRLDQRVALGTISQPDRLHHLDPVRLDDGFHGRTVTVGAMLGDT